MTGERRQEFEATVALDRDYFWVLNERGTTLKAFSYADIKTAEYTYSRAARWKSTVAGAPTAISASGNRHWFMVQTQDDYALLHLDKDTYRSVIGAFEIRSGKKVARADSK
jgi:hypothetical protein